MEKREGGRKVERSSRGKVGKEGKRKDMKRKKKFLLKSRTFFISFFML